MTFATESVKDGIGRALALDVSFDNFVTVAYRYGDKAGFDEGATGRSSRILSVAPIRRALGQNRIAASSATSVKLDNADGGLDWICGREGLALAASARFRLRVALYTPGATPLAVEQKLLGEFILSSWPRQDNSVVELDLADDLIGKLGVGLQLPTLLDWQAVGTGANNPIKFGMGLPSTLSENTPVQLSFGEAPLLALPHLIPWDNNQGGQPYEGKIIIPLYSTTDLSAAAEDLVEQVTVSRYTQPSRAPDQTTGADTPGGVLETVVLRRGILESDWISNGVVQRYLWTVEKSPTITKNGIDFQIVYLVMADWLGFGQGMEDFDRLLPTLAAPDPAAVWEFYSGMRYANGYDVDAVDGSRPQYWACASRLASTWVSAYPGSQVTNPPGILGMSHAADILTDLVSEYSSAPVNATSIARVKAGNPWAACTGVVQPWSERANNFENGQLLPYSLRQVLTSIAQSSDIDIFINWDGEIALSSDVLDFTTATQAGTLVEFQETECAGVSRWIPSNGERHAPFNRVYFSGAKASVVQRLEEPFQGPFDLSTDALPLSARVVEATIQQGWRPYRQQVLNPWIWRGFDALARDKVKFQVGLSGLRLDLGDYFRITWTRGAELGGPYLSTTFQCESIAYAPDSDTVEIEAIWRDDSVSERQYLLDDETLLVVLALTLTDTCSPTGGTQVDLGVSVDISYMVSGAILVLRDTTQADDIFTRNGAWRIIGWDSTLEASILYVEVNGEGDYPAVGTVASGQWAILYGATNYPTAISDPTNYPSGGRMYGKATAAAGTTSDAAVGNRLISG